MLKQILCCSLLVGQLCAGEHPRTPLPNELNAAEVNEAFMKRFPGVPNLLEGVSQGSVSNDQSADQAPETPVIDSVQEAPTVPAVSNMRRAPKFTAAEDAGIRQYVRAHSGRQNWNECLRDLTEQGIIAPGARTARQLADRYNRFLRGRHELAAVSVTNYAPRFTAEEDEGIMQYLRAHPGRQNWNACLKDLTEQGIIAPGARTARQLADRYNRFLRCRHELAAVNVTNYAPDFTEAEDAGIMQYVRAHPWRQNWDACLKDLTEQGIIAPGARTARQLADRYNTYLKAAAERKNKATAFTDEEDGALLRIVLANPELSWEDTAKLFAEVGASAPGVNRDENQLCRRYEYLLKQHSDDEAKSSDSDSDEEESL